MEISLPWKLGPTTDVEVVLAGYLFRLSHSSSIVGLFRSTRELRLLVPSSHLVYDTARRVGRVRSSWHWSVGPPGSRLPHDQPPGSGIGTIYHLRWQEEPSGFRKPCLWRRGRRDHYGDGFALGCLDGWPVAMHGQKSLVNQKWTESIIKTVIPPSPGVLS